MLLIVEGLTDAAFFQELFLRLYLKDGKRLNTKIPGRENMASGVTGIGADGAELEVEFRYELGKTDTLKVLDGLLASNVAEVVITQDIDYGTRDGIADSIRQHVHTFFGVAAPSTANENYTFEINGSTVHSIPMGLPGDAELAKFEIAQHELEDYLLLLVLRDPALRLNITELDALLGRILPVIREKDGPLDSSKDVLQLIKPLIQHGFSDSGVAEKIMIDANEEILKSVLEPLLSDIERATGYTRLNA